MVSRRTYIRRRITVFGALGLLLATGIYLPMSLLAPLEPITPALISVATPVNPPVELAWPSSGSAAIGAVGFPGVLAQGSDPSARPIASITKVITSLVVLQEKPLATDEGGPVITMTQTDVDEYHRQIANNGSAEPVSVGVDLTQRELLEVVLIASANNYAETIARWAFGSQDAFLAATRVWLDSHGLSGVLVYDASGIDTRNTATPADLVELGKLALANPVVASIVSSTSADVPYVGTIENTNELLGWNGVDGIKTGTVDLDNVNLLFATTITVGNQNIDLVGVVLGSQSHDELDSAVRALLDTALLGFTEVPLVTAGESFGTFSTVWDDHASAVAAKSASVVVWAGLPISMKVQIDPLSTGAAGQQVGSVTFTVDGQNQTVPLKLSEALNDPGPWWRLTHPFG